ncbi:MAG: hypothetical protein H5T72_01115 [Actinobacteria bacterium]|nr:hypothetical protein [Actinomycetota bacterium]
MGAEKLMALSGGTRGFRERKHEHSLLRRAAAEEGFTLAELMVVVGIMIIFLIGVAGMLESGADSSTTQYVLARMEEDAGKVLDTMTRQIRVATTINSFSTNGTLIFSGDLDGSGNVQNMVFTVSDGRLMRGSDIGNLQEWVDGVESITFTYHRFNPVTKAMETITPGTAGWNTLVQRVDFAIRFSRQAGRINLVRDYGGSVTLRNNL